MLQAGMGALCQAGALGLEGQTLHETLFMFAEWVGSLQVTAAVLWAVLTGIWPVLLHLGFLMDSGVLSFLATSPMYGLALCLS